LRDPLSKKSITKRGGRAVQDVGQVQTPALQKQKKNPKGSLTSWVWQVDSEVHLDEPEGHYTKWNKLVTGGQMMMIPL
jgi:hypothetical protein